MGVHGHPHHEERSWGESCTALGVWVSRWDRESAGQLLGQEMSHPGASWDGTKHSCKRWVQAWGARGCGDSTGFISPTAWTQREVPAANVAEAISPRIAPFAGHPLPRGTRGWGRLRGRLPGGAQGCTGTWARQGEMWLSWHRPRRCDGMQGRLWGVCEGCPESAGSGAVELPALASTLTGRLGVWGVHECG